MAWNFTQLPQVAGLHSDLSVRRCGDIELLVLTHAHCHAAVSLQGAQLVHWRPGHSAQDVIWLSAIEPFQAGQAIRGGIPVCYPWFGQAGTPAHGTARIRPWTLEDWQITAQHAALRLGLYDDEGIEARLEMVLGKTCSLRLTHLRDSEAQAALHSYFHIGDIAQTQITGLPTRCFDASTQQHITVPSPRRITAATDCIYPLTHSRQRIDDARHRRTITLNHHHASDVVLWNPWHNPPSAMQPDDYRHMLCLETARISRTLQANESLALEISVS